ncbi:MAG: helix-turn-helix domain-containing protein [Lactobacillus sp.]|nr:helix-turn-helix domain-containing protein [Lactobacillus sp.]
MDNDDQKNIAVLVESAVNSGIQRALHPRYEWLTNKQVCEWLTISKTTLYKWRKLGLPYSSIEGMNVYNKEQVNQWLLEHKQPKARS